VTKPFSIQELLARGPRSPPPRPERTAAAIEAGDFVLDSTAHTITVLGKPIHLTPKEFDLLLHLARHAGKVMDSSRAAHLCMGSAIGHQPEYLRVFVGQLRKKTRSPRRQAIHPDRALGRLPFHFRRLEREPGIDVFPLPSTFTFYFRKSFRDHINLVQNRS